jgi:hypothetical protein
VGVESCPAAAGGPKGLRYKTAAVF